MLTSVLRMTGGTNGSPYELRGPSSRRFWPVLENVVCAREIGHHRGKPQCGYTEDHGVTNFIGRQTGIQSSPAMRVHRTFKSCTSSGGQPHKSHLLLT